MIGIPEIAQNIFGLSCGTLIYRLIDRKCQECIQEKDEEEVTTSELPSEGSGGSEGDSEATLWDPKDNLEQWDDGPERHLDRPPACVVR